MKRFTFFTTAGCHLCEQAWEMLVDEQLHEQCDVTEISDDESLVEKYGVRIPVIADEQGNELGWPFDRASLVAFCTVRPEGEA